MPVFKVESTDNQLLNSLTNPLNLLPLFVLAAHAGVPQVTVAARGHQEAAARSVSVPRGGRFLGHATRSRASAAAATGRRGRRVTSAWRGMCVDQLASSVRLMCNLWFGFFLCSVLSLQMVVCSFVPFLQVLSCFYSQCLQIGYKAKQILHKMCQ